MIVGIGLDMTDTKRIKEAITNERFIERVYTAAEQEYCRRKGQGAVASYAARFAGKEAVLKALGVGLRGGSLTDIEITNDNLGAPHAELKGRLADLAHQKGVTKIHLSLTHLKEYAAAECIMEGTA